MKNILLFIILLSPLVMQAQDTHFTGDGTLTVPYSGGTLGGTSHHDESWSGTIYVSGDLTIGDYGHLTINAGTTIKFTSSGADLFITGTGQLTADASSGLQITFTADYDNDGHETGETWGHISFQSMGTSPASSTFDNCIFEYGYSTGTSSEPTKAGGALQVDFNNVTVTGCTFKDNYANYAGAVMINSNRNTIIKNSYFESNDAYECGGAIIIYTNSTALVENCIFANNYSKGYSSSSYSGGAIWSYSNSSKIVNCTFVENTSDQAGDAIYSYSSSGMTIINSILWGSNDQFAGSSSTSTFVTCAFESTKPANAANSIIISDVANDHFVNAGSGDWTLKFISPCRDAGVNSYTGVTIPSTDYDGNPRIGTKDIGTYEVQYSRWLTNASSPTSWSTGTNWEEGYYPGYTGTTGDVVIPLLTSAYAPNISGTTTISSGKYMVLEPGGKATFGTLSNSGTLRLESDASNIASLILSTYTDSGNEEIELYLSGGSSPDYKWHYISSPVSSIDTTVFTVATKNLVQFVESRPTSDLLEGWVACDGYVYSTGKKEGPTFGSLTAGKGYNYYDGTNNTFTFSGSLNTSDTVMSLGYSGSPSMNGFNLLGNPFSSGLDWDEIISDPSYPSSTSKGVYFTRDNSQCTYIGEVGNPGDVAGIIPPMQGFFTKTYSTGNSITLSAAARTHDAIHARYKGKGTIPLVRLSVFEDTESEDETVIRFDELAKTDLDNDFDALKMFLSASKTTIHSKIGETDYAINGQPFPESYVEIPIVVNMTSTGNHKISAIQLQGLEDYNVTLTDNSTGFIADLKSNPDFIFPAPAGLITDRFILKVTNIATAIETPEIQEYNFNIYHGFGLINIQTLADEWDGKTGSIKVLDLTGKTINDLQNTEFSKNSVTQLQVPDAKGLYIVEIKSGVKRHVGKVVIK